MTRPYKQQEMFRDAYETLMQQFRATVIEECARVAENYPYAFSYKVAAAIRALKDKP